MWMGFMINGHLENVIKNKNCNFLIAVVLLPERQSSAITIRL